MKKILFLLFLSIWICARVGDIEAASYSTEDTKITSSETKTISGGIYSVDVSESKLHESTVVGTGTTTVSTLTGTVVIPVESIASITTTQAGAGTGKATGEGTGAAETTLAETTVKETAEEETEEVEEEAEEETEEEEIAPEEEIEEAIEEEYEEVSPEEPLGAATAEYPYEEYDITKILKQREKAEEKKAITPEKIELVEKKAKEEIKKLKKREKPPEITVTTKRRPPVLFIVLLLTILILLSVYIYFRK